ncbi:hypothetical protein ABT272_28135 [Streptomyces sp900105245]|uniref:Uncharacterized protein n=1 Tax=Streptomyces sp. 900105245 TaxID=3154379 RepID=A0ABV1UCX3_9ACTN
MSDHEWQILICGMSYGAVLTTWLQAWLDSRDARRQRKASAVARRRAAADHYLVSLRLYRLQQRSRV